VLKLEICVNEAVLPSSSDDIYFRPVVSHCPFEDSSWRPSHTWEHIEDGSGPLERELALYEGLELPLLDQSCVFQEQLLAPCAIQFRHREIVWECLDILGVAIYQPNTLVVV
jgi:hypothetical protein